MKKQAEAVLAKVKAGGDFAALAKQYSEDGSKDAGGDLDYFGRGAYGEGVRRRRLGARGRARSADLVKTEFGFHIIKLTDKKAATKRTLTDVRAAARGSNQDRKGAGRSRQEGR